LELVAQSVCFFEAARLPRSYARSHEACYGTVLGSCRRGRKGAFWPWQVSPRRVKGVG
jgi:hypothetical protein